MDDSPGLLGILFGLIFAAFFIYCYWRIFEKAGKPGWASIIPIYSTIVLLEIVGKPWWWFFLLIIPVVNIVFAIWVMNLLSKSFGQGEGFTVGLILLSVVFIPLLALGDYQYVGPAGNPQTLQTEDHLV